MKEKANILIVEDQAINYKKLKLFLQTNYYKASAYTPSVAAAIASINRQSPDLVLLDIDLQGNHNGIYLGKLLQEQYHIPFIYVTDYDDDETFFKSKQTQPANFLTKDELILFKEATVVQTKPHLDEKKLSRAIQLALENTKQQQHPIIKDDMLLYTVSQNKTKELGNTDISQEAVPFKEIAYFTTNSLTVDEAKTKLRNKPCFVKLDRNNARIYTWRKKSYYLPKNLTSILDVVPHTFVRISEDYIVNLDNEMVLDGRINGKRIQVAGQVLEISDTFKAEVEKRFEELYQKL